MSWLLVCVSLLHTQTHTGTHCDAHTHTHCQVSKRSVKQTTKLKFSVAHSPKLEPQSGNPVVESKAVHGE